MTSLATWESLPFDELFRDFTGGNPRVEQGHYQESGILPVVDQGQADIAGYVNDPALACRTPLPCLVFGDHTRIVKYVDHSFAMGAHGVKILVPIPEVDPRFAYYALQRVRFPADTGYTRHSRFLKRVFIAFPPLAEQRRIAAVLDKADAVRRKRRESLRLLDEFLRSAFLEMFGDPVRNEKGWEDVAAGEIFAELRYGTSVKCSSAHSATDLPVLRIPNVVDGEVSWSDLKFAHLEAAEIERLRLSEGDLLFVRTNGNPEYIGRCAVFYGNRQALFASYLIRGRLRDQVGYRPLFLKHVVSFPSYRARLVAQTRTTAGNYNISTTGLNRLVIIRPPLTLQDRFLAVDASVRKQRQTLGGALAASDDLFDSLAQRAFRGEL